LKQIINTKRGLENVEDTAVTRSEDLGDSFSEAVQGLYKMYDLVSETQDTASKKEIKESPVDRPVSQ
jgi:hypothetical protein